jgi:gamma-glutamylcyclotransferase (GGCT)/AIG2-like uncharacterized protein YtfP
MPSDPSRGGPPDRLFAYGTLRHPDVLRGLLGRVPATAPAAAPGWRAAELRGRVYPGLVPDPAATAPGLLITGLTPEEWRVLDDFEDDHYDRRPLPLADGSTATAYVWTAGGDVLPGTWSFAAFERRHAAACTARFRSGRG